MSNVAFIRAARRAAAPLALLLAAACADGGEPSGANVTLQLATRARTGAAASSLASLDGGTTSFTDGTNTLVLTKVELVLAEFHLEEDDGDFGCTGPIVAPDTVASCAHWVETARLLDLPLGTAGALRAFGTEVPPGLYHKAGFHVMPIDPTEDDPNFVSFPQRHPEFTGISVRAQGTWNGVPFTYTGRPNREFGLWFAQPLVVTEGATAQVTIFVELERWFRDGTALIDPSTALEGGPNEALVRGNIEAAFSAFEDEDEDGVCDDEDEPDDEDDGDEGEQPEDDAETEPQG